MTEPAWLVDTNILSHYIRREAPQEYPKLVTWLDGVIRGQGLTISAVTLYELRRGIKAAQLDGKSRRKAVRLEMLLRSADVLGLDTGQFAGWNIAADLWAHARTAIPGSVFSEADFLIFATAQVHGRKLATADRRLWERLREIGQGVGVQLIELK
jgi:predicted nucleic acid-binding protein